MLPRNAYLFAFSCIATLAPLITAREFYGVNFVLSENWESRGYGKHFDDCDGKGFLSVSVLNKGVKYNFTGSRIEAHFVTASDGALADIEIDEQPRNPISTFNSLAKPETCSLMVYDSGNLTAGAHSISIFHGGNDPSNPQNSTLRLNRLVIFLDHEPTVPGRIPESTSTASPSESDSKPPPKGIIIGAVVGGSLCFVLMCLIIVVVFRKHRQGAQEYHKLGGETSDQTDRSSPWTRPLHPNPSEDTNPLMRTATSPGGQSLYQPISPASTVSPSAPFYNGGYNQPIYSPPMGPPLASPVSSVYHPPAYPVSQPPSYTQTSPTSPYGMWHQQPPNAMR